MVIPQFTNKRCLAGKLQTRKVFNVEMGDWLPIFRIIFEGNFSSSVQVMLFKRLLFF